MISAVLMQETSFLVHRTQPQLLSPNKEGYTVLAMSWCPEELPKDSWRLNVLSQQPLLAWAQLPSTRQDLFEGAGACIACMSNLPFQSTWLKATFCSQAAAMSVCCSEPA